MSFPINIEIDGKKYRLVGFEGVKERVCFTGINESGVEHTLEFEDKYGRTVESASNFQFEQIIGISDGIMDIQLLEKSSGRTCIVSCELINTNEL